MRTGDLIVMKGPEILSLLEGREKDLIKVVRRAYEVHAAGGSSLPHSVFLRFPSHPKNRIIALPAWLGEDFAIAGIKWIASFPENLGIGMDRASGVLILSSAATGAPEAIMEGSIISAKRTAASAALAAGCLHDPARMKRVGMVGCGLINFEIARFLLAAYPGIETFAVFDTDPGRALHFQQKLNQDLAPIPVTVFDDVQSILETSPLISIATNAASPHIADLTMCPAGATILHVSLRDITPEAILSCENVVDDIDHVCRAETSIHLASKLAGSANFIATTLGGLLGAQPGWKRNPAKIGVFSPFGLGILDLAVGKFVRDLGIEHQRAVVLDSFLPRPWAE